MCISDPPGTGMYDELPFSASQHDFVNYFLIAFSTVKTTTATTCYQYNAASINAQAMGVGDAAVLKCCCTDRLSRPVAGISTPLPLPSFYQSSLANLIRRVPSCALAH